MGSPVSPIVANLYMEHFEREALWSASNPPSIGLGMWMTLWSSNNRSINKYSWNISIAKFQQPSLLLKITKEMGPSPSLIP